MAKPTKKLVEAARAYIEQQRAAQEAGNAANRAKTALRNVMKAEYASLGIPGNSPLKVDSKAITLQAAETEFIDPEKVFIKYVDEEIDSQTFIGMITIGKTEAKRVFGGDQILEMTETKVGKDANVRVVDLPVDEQENTPIIIGEPYKRRRIKKKVSGELTSKSSARPRPRSRKIRT